MLASHSGSLGAAFQLLLLLLVHRLLLFGGRGKEPRAEHLHPELVEAIAGHQQPQVPEIVAVGRQHQHDRGEDDGVLQVPANGKREISVGERERPKWSTTTNILSEALLHVEIDATIEHSPGRSEDRLGHLQHHLQTCYEDDQRKQQGKLGFWKEKVNNQN